jgi:hypothetical protein
VLQCRLGVRRAVDRDEDAVVAGHQSLAAAGSATPGFEFGAATTVPAIRLAPIWPPKAPPSVLWGQDRGAQQVADDDPCRRRRGGVQFFLDHRQSRATVDCRIAWAAPANASTAKGIPQCWRS